MNKNYKQGYRQGKGNKIVSQFVLHEIIKYKLLTTNDSNNNVDILKIFLNMVTFISLFNNQYTVYHVTFIIIIFTYTIFVDVESTVI